ncbi:tape measure protein [Leucobacter sp. CSA1]|uniref:Tape measure protein n=1 Tax=Leucobacter chromiisoli TaxID=2796471 RepID=A0A934Q4M6_9MICO|nr:tape measure protein [Leucobacter chromiisoli]MBK0418274.1 tape measure protein [Leucobacter chromiisoli]
MAERIVTIKLIAEATGLVQGFNRAKDAVAETKTKVEESARSSREEWAKVGTGLTAVGVAITGVGAAALKTGIQYNTLQQTTRAALTSLLGSAQAANAQMDKLDDFARNSPFSKATFITAQQQMLAFGIEAKKVIPYLDGVQNAVAAAGGSNADIEGIVATMSKIQSSSKITATDLMEFGNRGVNAAELIGSQMGKTGAQIREDITAGTLSAEDALDALAKGMSETYEGAADNVKNTFAGAMDRVKAAWRDFSAELAAPLVDPNGGGALVDLLNWAADAMRAFEDLPGPVKTTVTALTGLVGVGTLVAGTAILALPKWLAFKDALATFSPATATARGGLMGIVRFLGGPWGIALMAAAASVAVFNAAMDGSKASAQQMETAIKQGKSALDEMSSTAAQNEQGLTTMFVNVGQHIDDLPALMDKAATAGRGFFSSMTFNENAALDVVAEFGTTLSNLAATDLPRAQAAFKAFYDTAGFNDAQALTAINEEMPGFKNGLIDAANAAGLATDDATLLKLALGELEGATADAAEGGEQVSASLAEIQGVAASANEAITALAEEIAGFGSAQIDAEKAALAFEEQLASLNQRVAEGATGLDLSTESGRENRASLLAMAEATNTAAAATLQATGSQESANATLGRGRDALIAAAIQYGWTEAEAKAYADQVMATPETVATWFSNNADAARAAVEQYKNTIDAIKSQVATTITTTLDVFTNLSPDKKAYGGTVGYAAGGTIGGIGGGIADGTVYGRGGTKSDSVLVRLSRGEEVIQEPYASMYRRELKQMNRGDFAPSSAAGHQVIVVREVGDVYVQNPFTGKYLLSKVDAVANSAIDQFVEQTETERRRAGV